MKEFALPMTHFHELGVKQDGTHDPTLVSIDLSCQTFSCRFFGRAAKSRAADMSHPAVVVIVIIDSQTTSPPPVFPQLRLRFCCFGSEKFGFLASDNNEIASDNCYLTHITHVSL